MLFSKVKINSAIIFAFKSLGGPPPPPKFLHQVWLTSFSVEYAMNPITENVLDISCCKNG